MTCPLPGLASMFGVSGDIRVRFVVKNRDIDGIEYLDCNVPCKKKNAHNVDTVRCDVPVEATTMDKAITKNR